MGAVAFAEDAFANALFAFARALFMSLVALRTISAVQSDSGLQSSAADQPPLVPGGEGTQRTVAFPPALGEEAFAAFGLGIAARSFSFENHSVRTVPFRLTCTEIIPPRGGQALVFRSSEGMVYPHEPPEVWTCFAGERHSAAECRHRMQPIQSPPSLPPGSRSLYLDS